MTAGAIQAGKAAVKLELKSTLKRDLAKQLSHVKKFAGQVKASTQFAFKNIGKVGLVGGAAGGFLVKLGGDLEKTRLVFKNLVGDADMANKVISDMTKFADATPFTNDDILQSSKLLLANGTAVKNLGGEMRTLATLAAKAGSTTGELALILQDIRGKGKVDSTDLRQFASRGINLRAALGSQMGIGQAGVQSRISSGSVSAAEVEAALKRLADGLPNLLNDVGSSFNGLMSTLTGSLKTTGAEFGQIIIEDFDLKGILKTSIDFLKENKTEVLSSFKEIMLNIRAFVEQLKVAVSSLTVIGRTFMDTSGIGLAMNAVGGDSSFDGFKGALRQRDFANKMHQKALRDADPFLANDKANAFDAQTKKLGLLTIDDIQKFDKGQAIKSKFGIGDKLKGITKGLTDGVLGAGRLAAQAGKAGGSGLSGVIKALVDGVDLPGLSTTRGTSSSSAVSRYLGMAQASPLDRVVAESVKQTQSIDDLRKEVQKIKDKFRVS